MRAVGAAMPHFDRDDLARYRARVHGFVAALAIMTRSGRIITPAAIDAWRTAGEPTANFLRNVPLSRKERQTCRQLRRQALCA